MERIPQMKSFSCREYQSIQEAKAELHAKRNIYRVLAMQRGVGIDLARLHRQAGLSVKTAKAILAKMGDVECRDGWYYLIKE